MFPVLFSFLFVPIVFILTFFVGLYSLVRQGFIDQPYYILPGHTPATRPGERCRGAQAVPEQVCDRGIISFSDLHQIGLYEHLPSPDPPNCLAGGVTIA